MQLTSRHLVALLIVVGSLMLALFLVKDFGQVAGIVGIAGGVIGVLYAGAGGTSGPPVEVLVDAVRKATQGDPPATPAGTTGPSAQVFEELRRFAETVSRERETEKLASAETRAAVDVLDDLMKRLGDGVGTQLSASEETARSIKDMTSALKDIAQHVEVLAASAQESSSSILEMTATN